MRTSHLNFEGDTIQSLRSVIGFRVHSNWVQSHLKWIPFAKPFFPDRSHSQVPGVRTEYVFLCGVVQPTRIPTERAAWLLCGLGRQS